MKRLILIALIGILAFAEGAAQDLYSIGYATETTLTYSDTIDVKVVAFSTVAKLTPDTTTACVINLASTSTANAPGSTVYFKITASSTAATDTIVWGSGFTSNNTLVDSTKTKVIPFVYDGSNYVGCGTEVQID